MEKLDGKVALVTGSSRGIGRAVAVELARKGCDVAVNYRAQEALAHEVVDEIETLSRELGFKSVHIIPISALLGDNVVESSANIPWYEGPSVLEALCRHLGSLALRTRKQRRAGGNDREGDDS